MPSCCGSELQDSSALTQHQKDKHGRHRCKQCPRSFSTQAGLDDHNDDLHDSTTRDGKKHSSATPTVGQIPKKMNDHHCGDCKKSFVDAAGLMQHRQSSAHAVQFRCCDCERNFISLDALQQHLKDKVHKPKTARERPRIMQCPKCSRQFQSEQALRDHESSVVHRSVRNLVCAIEGDGGPRSCNRRFRSPSAMLHHLESGGCPSGMNRAKLNMLVVRNDTERAISSPDFALQGLLREATRRLATSRATTPTGDMSRAATKTATTSTPESGDDHEAVLTPSSSSGTSGNATSGVMLTPSSTMASASLLVLTPSSGYSSTVVSAPGGTRCPLCPPTRRQFATLQSLQQHLLSPAHDAQIFHCPVSSPSVFTIPGGAPQGKAATVKWFSTLSGMVQHVESGACVGSGADFNKAVSYLEARIKGLGLPMRRTISI